MSGDNMEEDCLSRGHPSLTGLRPRFNHFTIEKCMFLA